MISNYKFEMLKKDDGTKVVSHIVDIKKWASKPIWTLEESAALILGVNPEMEGPNMVPTDDTDFFHKNGYAAYRQARLELTDELVRYTVTGLLPLINNAGRYYISPKNCLEYCRYNGLLTDQELRDVILLADNSDKSMPTLVPGNDSRSDVDKLLDIGVTAGIFCSAEDCEVTKNVLSSVLSRQGYKNVPDNLLLKLFKLLPEDVKVKGRPSNHIDHLIRAALFVGTRCSESDMSYDQVKKLIARSGNSVNNVYAEKIFREINGLGHNN